MRRVYYTVAPVQHGVRYLLRPDLVSSALSPLINLSSDCPQDSLVLIRGGKYVYDARTPVQTHTHTHSAANRKAAVTVGVKMKGLSAFVFHLCSECVGNCRVNPSR